MSAPGQDSYQYSDNTIILLVTQCKNDNTAFLRRQKCHQEVVNRGFTFVQGGVTFKFDKNSTNLLCFIFQFAIWGLSPPKPPPPRGNGTVQTYWQLRLPEGTKKICDRLWAVGCVGGKHLVSVDADNYVFAIFFMAMVACASEATCGKGFKCALQKDSEQWCSQTFWFEWSKTRIPPHEYKEIFTKWRHFATMALVFPWLRPCSTEYLVPLYSVL